MVRGSSSLGEIWKSYSGGKGRPITLTVPLTLEQVTRKYKTLVEKEFIILNHMMKTQYSLEWNVHQEHSLYLKILMLH